MQQEFDCVKLRFSTPLHLSRGREQFDESAKVLHSDTLAAALFMAARQLGAPESEALAMLDGLRLSSAFPFWETEHFFPKPMAPLPFDLKDVPEEKQGKPFKKIRFLGKSWFEKLLNAESAVIDREKHLTEKEFLSDHPVKTVYKADVTQRVTIPPDYSDDARPFYTERLYFGRNAGLYVLVQWQDAAVKDLFQRAFRFLGDLGIGTDRSVGNGFFEPAFGALQLRVPDTAAYQCALGLYLPAENELSAEELDNSAWSLSKRGGYMAGAADTDHIMLRKRSVFMFEEGSIFPNKPLTGKRVNLKPVWQGLEHDVLREGKPVFVPFQKTPDNNEN
jgi:CRISPR-associated protein Csm4